jgi:hypothetical protein
MPPDPNIRAEQPTLTPGGSVLLAVSAIEADVPAATMTKLNASAFQTIMACFLL